MNRAQRRRAAKLAGLTPRDKAAELVRRLKAENSYVNDPEAWEIVADIEDHCGAPPHVFAAREFMKDGDVDRYCAALWRVIEDYHDALSAGPVSREVTLAAIEAAEAYHQLMAEP